jgi:endonuclease G
MSWATFVMTNIVPQAPHVNQGAWADLEDYCRDLVRREQARLYVVAGPMGEGGRGSTGGVTETIAKGKVRVPAACWKVVVVVPAAATNSADDLMNIGAGTRVIAVVMPNDNAAIGHDWAKYRTSAGEIERQTGLHFFDRLPGNVAKALRGKVDTAPIGPARQ